MAKYDKAVEEARKAKFDADAAEVAAKKAAREEAEASTPAAVARREATAEKDAAAARREQISALVPDFSKIDRGSLAVTGDEPTAGTSVGGRALQKAAELVKEQVVQIAGADDWSVLVTSDGDLAGSDAAYHSTVASLKRLRTWARSVLAATEPPEPPKRQGIIPALPVAAAVASAIPGIVSLLSAHRSVTTAKGTIDDVAAGAAVAGALKGGNAKRRIFHDATRTLPTGGAIMKEVDGLYRLREKLIARKAELEVRKPADDADKLAANIALAAKVAESIEDGLATLMAVGEGSTRSPLAAAILREGLHDGTIKYVLFVKSQSASGAQLVNDKPLWLDDKFSVLAAASISWVLVDPASGEVLDADVTTGTAQANGKIGETFEFAR